MNAFLPLAILIATLFLVAALVQCQPSVDAQAMPTMSATWFWPTPTPIVAQPVILTEFVFIPMVRR